MLLQSLIGGLIIGSAVALLLLGRGQIAGISGIVGNLVEGRSGGWRLPFLLGFVAAPLIVWLAGGSVPGRLELPWPLAVGAGLLVGFGTRLGNGCTSGHGLCGLGNLSRRSLVASVLFFGTAALTVFAVRHLLP